MKVVILAGGLGTRLGEETDLRPKPMVTIGGQPILWHIMKYYSSYGLNEFVICAGYMSHIIKQFFAHSFVYSSDFTIDLQTNEMSVLHKKAEPWKVTVIDTGLHTQTGGRIKRICELLDETFCLTYGDGLCDVDIKALLALHKSSSALATLTAVNPPARFGALTLEENSVVEFLEKPANTNTWINGGFFVCEPEVMNLIDEDNTIWERQPLQNLAQSGKLQAHKHKGFWAAMDTLRDRRYLEDLWARDQAPWKKWV